MACTVPPLPLVSPQLSSAKTFRRLHALSLRAPSLSRPHPANNPHPTAYPPDNASVLTLASSTAAQSITGGATSTSSRGHGGIGGGAPRSLVGSLMGERRNSSDTYASVKALPPLSRRGSDDSTRASGKESVRTTASGAAPAAIGSSPLATSGSSTNVASGVGSGGAIHTSSENRESGRREVA